MNSKKKPIARKTIKKKNVIAESVVEAVVVPIAQEHVAKPIEKLVEETVFVRQPYRLLIAVLLLGWGFDFLFWKQPVGINFALLLTLCILVGVSILFAEGYKPALNSLWLLFPFMFFAVITFIRQEPLTIFLAYTFTLFSIGLFANTYLGGRWHLYLLSDYFYKFVLLIGDMLVRPIGFLRQVRKASEEVKDRGRFPIFGLVRGLVIALPIVLCFGSLLASADVVFNQKLDDFFGTEKISEYIQRFILIIIFAYLMMGILLYAATRSKDEKITGEGKSIIKPFLGFTESAVVLGSVSFLFLAFVVVQFQYFFGGETNIGVDGYTYSQYARRGFNELIAVAFFSLVMILGLGTLTHRENDRQKRFYSGISVVVVVLVMVILVSAYQRISLGIDWHGFSRYRLYPRVFLIWLGILFVAVVVLEIFQRERYFAFATVLVILGFAVTLTLFNIDAATVKHNVFRAWHGKNLNTQHLASLSTDAVPALAEEFLSSSLPTVTREGVGAILACYKYSDYYPDHSQHDWRSFNLSRWQAQKALEQARPHLADYVIRYNKWPVRVRTPSNYLFECWNGRPFYTED